MDINLLQAFILALLQGLTEFIPISSSGHLVLIRQFLGWQDDGGLIFDTLLHAGSFFAICLYFYKDIINTLKICFGIIIKRRYLNSLDYDLSEQEFYFYSRLPWLLFIATVPIVLTAPFLKDFLAEAECGARNSRNVGLAMIATALLFFLCDSRQKASNSPMASYFHSFIIGVFQIIALLPGASRSGWTTAAGILCGYSRKEALRFSFLMALPALLGAMIFNIKDIMEKGSTDENFLIMATGFVVSFITSLAAIHFCLQYFKNHKLRAFAVYLSMVGLLAIFFSF